MKKRGYLPNGDLHNEAEWKVAKKRAKASLPPYCKLCGGLIDMDAKPFTPNACEVDHIIPIARGGNPYALENLQLTHSRCNRQKGKKMASDYNYQESDNICPVSNQW